jgi:RNA-directed DNA polymerase
MAPSTLISALARSLVAGELTVDAASARATRTLGRRWRWIGPLAQRYVETFGGRVRPRHREVVQFLLGDPGFRRAHAKYRDQLSIAEWLPEPQRMQAVAAAQRWQIPAIETTGDLADWLCLHPAELEWFADLKGLNNKQRASKLQHYHYRVFAKRSGGVRLIEIPKSNLKALQRRILSGILDRVPAHAAAHGFVKGRSIATFARPHVGKRVVLRLDLQDFFPTFPAARAQAIFRTLGYPEPVADRLGAICANAVPRTVFGSRPPEIDAEAWQEAGRMYACSHLPQGAPTSPALANLAAYRLDSRLSGLAKTAGAAYSRYADDLAFSGDQEFSARVRRFSIHAAAIALEEGFSVNHHKTRIMRRSRRQQVAGVVVNQKLNLPRREVELLEAMLTNCVHSGPGSQNRERLRDFRAHLQGRVSFVEMINRGKGRKLRTIFESIDWASP